MTPSMYITTVICITIVAVAAMIFMPVHRSKNDRKDDE